MANPNQDARATTGQYVRTPETAARDAQAAELRAQGLTYQKIADELGFGHKDSARLAVRRALRDIVKGPAEQLLKLEADRLDTLYEEALEVLQRDHVTVSHGKVITVADPDTGEEKPLLDDGPKLAAIDRLVKIRESYRKLFGLDQPAKVQLSGGVRYEVVGVDPEDLT
jgi:hypothetical protein